MAESFKINIEFEAASGFKIPENINVPLNSKIEWHVVDMDINQSTRRFSSLGLKFQLYFRDDSPFSWKTKSTDMLYSGLQGYERDGRKRQLVPKIQLLASGIAQERGEFKYGVRVIDKKTNDELFDDDPFLNVF